MQRRNKVKLVLWMMITTILFYISPSVISSYKTSLHALLCTKPSFLATSGFCTSHSISVKCPSVLDLILSGKWIGRPMTPHQKKEMREFLEIARNEHGLPTTLQRKDKKCGNVTLLPNLLWFRALCDQYGSIPCCYNNKCVAKEVEECRCKDCFDTRQVLHAEYADWLPSDKRCNIRKFNSRSACELLAGKTILMSGDSLMRHVYTSFLLLLRNNTVDGAMKMNVSKAIRNKCTGMFMFTEKVCRLQLDRTPRDLCGGIFELFFTQHFHSDTSRQFVEKVKELVSRKKVLIIVGLGGHLGLKHAVVMNKFIKPAFKVIQKHEDVQMLFAPPHCPGQLKNTLNGQSKEEIEHFVKEMKKELKPRNISIFDTCYITDGMESFDGSHFGLGINMLKVQLLLNYIQEL